MICSACGCEQVQGSHFCRQCGSPLGAPAPGPAPVQVLHHLVHDGMFSDAPPFLPHMMGALVPFIAISSVVMGAIGVLVGYGLLTRQPWARVLAMIFGIVSLIKIPFGTALGIYTLWVLGSGASATEWDIISSDR